MKTKITLLLLAFFMFVSNSYSQNTFDGDYCPGPGVTGDEYVGQLTTGALNNSGGTCEISQVWAKVDNLNASLRLAFKIGNAGTALIRLYIDTDNNSMSGLITDTSFGSGPAAGGAEFILQINTNSGATKLFQAATSTTVIEIPLPPGGLSGLNGDSNGCIGGDKVFVEFYIPFASIGYNPCNTTQPGTINVARYASVSGGSTNSSMCTSQSLNFGVPLSGSVTPNQSNCQGTSSAPLNLTINGGINTTIQSWQSSTDGVTFVDISGTGNSYTYSPGILSVGDHYFRAKILNTGICVNAFYSSAAKITVNAAPVAPTTTLVQPTCTLTTGTLNITSPLPGIGISYTVTGTNPVVPAITNTTGIFAGLTSGIYSVTSKSATGCVSVPLSVTIIPQPITPAAPTAPVDVTVCETGLQQTLTAIATVPLGSTIVWYDESNGGNIVNPPTLVSTIAATKTLYGQTSNGTCSSLTRTAVTLTIKGAPNAPASNGNIIQCELSPIQTLNANSALSSTIGITWYNAATGGNIVASPTRNTVGTTTYYAQFSNGTCSSLARTAVTLTITGAPSAPGSNGNITQCELSPIQTLNANSALLSTTGVTWYDAASGGNIVVSPTQNTVGTTTYFAQYTNGTCSSLTRTAVTLTITGAPSAPASSGNITECELSPIQTLNANSALSSTTGITWYDAATSGNIVASPIRNTVGTSIYYAQFSNGTCSSLARTAVTLTITGAPNAPSSSGNIIQCEVSPIQTLNANSALSSTTGITWYDAATGGNIVASPTRNTVGTTTYFAQYTNGTCSSLTRTAVTLTITGAPSAPTTGGNKAACQASPIQTLTATATVPSGFSIIWYDAAIGGNVVTSPTWSSVGVKTYYAEALSNTTSCRSNTRTAVSLEIYPALIANATGEALSCARDSDGNITLTVQGGTAPFNYSWKKTGDMVTVVSTAQNPSGLPAGTYNVIIIDSKQCTTTASATIIDGDGTAPVISQLPGNTTIECPNEPAFTTATASDSVDPNPTLSFNDVTTRGLCPSKYSITRTWTAKDACGNTSTKNQTIIVQDTSAPVFAAAPENVTIECIDDLPPMVSLAYTDNCDPSGTQLGADATQVGDNCGGTIARTWNVSDSCGNPAITRTQIITIKDTTAPILAAAPENVTIECIDDLPPMVSLTYTDNCDAAGTQLGADANQVGDNCGGTITRTWNVSDSCGNSAITRTQIITIKDTTSPVLVIAPENVTIECIDDLPPMVSLAYTDNCDPSGTQLGADATQVGDNCGGTIIRTWNVSDKCGNPAITKTQIITIKDTTAPVLTAAPEDVTIECIDDLPPMISLAYTDNCDPSGTQLGADASQVGDNCGGTITRTWNVSDKCGNPAITRTQIITVKDTKVPNITTSATSINVECDGSGNQTAIANWLANNGGAVATDNCSEVKWTNSFDALSNDCSTAVTILFTATDICGNSSSTSATFSVNDTTKPTFVEQLPPDFVTAECNNIAAAVTLTATDNCGTAIVTYTEVKSNVSETCPSNYTLTRTWTATDACNNPTTHVQTVTVEDKTVPIWTTLAASLNATVECSNTEGLVAVQAQFPMATDNCDSDVTNISKTAGQFVADEGCANSGTYTNTWTVTDACENTSATFTQVITVEDKTAPTWTTNTAALNATVECSNTEALAAAQSQFPVAADNCDSDVTNISKTTGQFVANEGCANSGTYTNTWTVTDACGNTSATFTQVITVEDKTAPTWTTLTAALNATVECSNTEALAAAQAQFPVAADNCDSDVTNISKTTGQFVANEGCANSGTYTNTWTVTDACGNTSATFTQVITVEDKTAPTWTTLTAALNATVECSNTEALAAAQAQFPVAADNCDSDVTNISKTAGQFVTDEGCANSGTYTNTWTVTDACGNPSATFTQVITVEDKTAPTWTTLTDALNTRVECSNTEALAAAQAQFPMAADDCDSDVTNISKTVGQFVANEGCANSGTYTNTWTVTDACGNPSGVFTQVITVEDKTAPTWTTLTASLNTTVECSKTEALAAAQAQFPAAADNCDSDVTNISKTAGQFVSDEGCANSGTYTNTWTVTDACGNTSATFTQVITVEDKTAPTWTTLAASLNTTVECSNTEALAAAQAQFPVAADNCDSDVTNISKTAGQFVANEGCANSGTYTNTWTVTDACGNPSAIFTQVITVEDKTVPLIAALPAPSTISCPATPEFAVATAKDACESLVNLTWTDVTTPKGCAGSYSVTRTWTAKDACGNTSTASQTINVTDTTGPTNTTAFAPSIDVLCDAIPAKPELVFVDNCSTVATPVYTEKIINQTPISYSIEREWNVADACGNSSKFVQLVNVSIANTGSIIQSSACNADSTPIDLNTLLPAGTPTNGVWINQDNIGILQGSIFYPLDATLGNHIFEYKVTEGSCPLEIKINMNVNFDCKVLGCEAIVVHNAFTPNGDGINEQLVIDGVEDTICYPTGISIEIYNRWGVLVFETTKYNNTSNAFEGYSKGRTTISQSDGLPTGTYFYIVNYESFDTTGNIQMNKKDGFLYLSR